MLWRALPTRLWFIGLLSLAGLAAAFYLLLSRGVEATVTEQLLELDVTISRAAASNIQSLFAAVGDSTALRAQMRSMERRDSTTTEDLDAFVNQWGDSGLIAGILLTDSQGVVRFNSNILGTYDVGESLTDRDYFAWAKNQKAEGEYFIGQPVVSREGASDEGQVIVPVCSPVFKDDVFGGVVCAAVKLAPLTQRFLELMKVSEKTSIYLVDQRRELLYSSPESPALSDNLKEALDTSQEEGRLRKDGHLIAHSQVSLGNQKWLLIVVSPIEEVFNLTIPFYIRQVAALILVSLTTLAFGIIVSRESQNKL